jgi:hypothetical protein
VIRVAWSNAPPLQFVLLSLKETLGPGGESICLCSCAGSFCQPSSRACDTKALFGHFRPILPWRERAADLTQACPSMR